MKKILHSENIIVAIIMVVIVVLSVVFIGIGPIKAWLKEPIVWTEAEYIEMSIINIVEEKDNEMRVEYCIINTSDNNLRSFEFITMLNGVEVQLTKANEYYNQTYQTFVTSVKFTSDPSLAYYGTILIDETTYNELLNTPANDVDFSYKTVYLEGEDANGGDFKFKNNGTVKIILIVAVSAVLAFLGIGKAKQPWLRIILKVCGLPAILLVLIVIFAIAILGAGGGKSTGNTGSNGAQERYKRAANHKAGAQIQGDKANAAKAQAEMDKAMADMIAGSSNDASMRRAQERYKTAANHKAGAVIHGDKANAARAQAEMDKALADMMKNK